MQSKKYKDVNKLQKRKEVLNFSAFLSVLLIIPHDLYTDFDDLIRNPKI